MWLLSVALGKYLQSLDRSQMKLSHFITTSVGFGTGLGGEGGKVSVGRNWKVYPRVTPCELGAKVGKVPWAGI